MQEIANIEKTRDEIKERFLTGFKLITQLEKQFEQWKVIDVNINYSISNMCNIRNNETGYILKQHINMDGYKYVHLSCHGKDKKHRVHRLMAEAFINNPDNKSMVDHKDRIRLNNNIYNLRWATASENNQNMSLSKRNKTGTTGVHYWKPSNEWYALIMINKKSIHGGYFATKEEAIAKRQELERIHFGDFARTKA